MIVSFWQSCSQYVRISILACRDLQHFISLSNTNTADQNMFDLSRLTKENNNDMELCAVSMLKCIPILSTLLIFSSKAQSLNCQSLKDG